MNLPLLAFLGLIGYLFYQKQQNMADTTETIIANAPTVSRFTDWRDLKRFAESQGFYVTSTTGGQHNVGSKHYLGRAIDVRTWNKTNSQITAFMALARAQGIRVLDERTRPPGQKVWSGAHLHLDI